MMKMNTVTGIKKAVGTANKALSCGLSVRFYVDCSTSTWRVWSNEYADCNSYSAYDNEAIFEVLSGNGLYGQRVKMEDIKAAIIRLQYVLTNNPSNKFR